MIKTRKTPTPATPATQEAIWPFPTTTSPKIIINPDGSWSFPDSKKPADPQPPHPGPVGP